MTISQLVLGGSTVGTLGFKEQGRRIIRSIVITLQENEFYPPCNPGKDKNTILILWHEHKIHIRATSIIFILNHDPKSGASHLSLLTCPRNMRATAAATAKKERRREERAQWATSKAFTWWRKSEKMHIFMPFNQLQFLLDQLLRFVISMREHSGPAGLPP